MKSELKSKYEITEYAGKRGIYILYENGKPIYVGRSNNLKKRIQEHSRPSSGHNSASFAFILAKEVAKQKNPDLDLTMERSQLEKDKRFKPIFDSAKERISKMKVRLIEIEQPEVQAIFEIFTAMSIGSKYNDFDNH